MQNFRLGRIPAVVLAVVLGMIVTGCAGEDGLGGPRIGGSPAASVGGVTISVSDLEAEVEAWASSPETLLLWPGLPPDPESGQLDIGEPGRRSSDLVTFALTLQIQREQAEQLLEAYGRAVTRDVVDDVERELRGMFVDPATGRFIFDNYDEEFRRYIIESFAVFETLSAIEFGLDDQPFASPPTATVNPRFGEAVDAGGGWVSVEPPSGPRRLPEPFSFG